MKQILTYISPQKEFNEEHSMAIKIQIDNSLRLGWNKEDILLITNFEYEYQGVKSIVIGDENYCGFFFPATKIYVIDYLFKNGMIEDDMYWYHDFDCFQLNAFDTVDIPDIGLTNYNRMPRLCSASIFFKKTAGDLFALLKGEVDRSKRNEETSLSRILNRHKKIQKRIKLLNITYAFHKFNLGHSYSRAIKPIKAVHFHLTPDKYDFYVRGNNKLNMVLIPEGLINIFHKHGFNK
jgi:hypothetical protein